MERRAKKRRKSELQRVSPVKPDLKEGVVKSDGTEQEHL